MQVSKGSLVTLQTEERKEQENEMALNKPSGYFILETGYVMNDDFVWDIDEQLFIKADPFVSVGALLKAEDYALVIRKYTKEMFKMDAPGPGTEYKEDQFIQGISDQAYEHPKEDSNLDELFERRNKALDDAGVSFDEGPKVLKDNKWIDEGFVVFGDPAYQGEQEGIRATLQERGKRYGRFIDNATLSQDLKCIVAGHSRWHLLDNDMKEAIEIIFQKVSRIITGDAEYIDNWTDISGYATLIEDQLKENVQKRVEAHK